MSSRTTTIPKPFHNAVIKWRDTYLTDYDYLIDNWEKYFPQEPRFELCAYREMGMCSEIECGDDKGKPKATRPVELAPERAHHLLGAIRAQASTEFGSIQQHRATLARAQDEEEQVWILRMMAEELRHGYQMLHLLLEDDWSCVSQETGADMVEEILSMTTGSHVLGAFNIDFDSFVDNVVFCALIDRVGKYQLQMQSISAYKPMAESMPQMLREEAFHLAAGVIPMRRWVEKAAQGEVYVTMRTLQKALNKWLPRGLEMFGDERGGGSNVRFGLKDMKNAEAQDAYYRGDRPAGPRAEPPVHPGALRGSRPTGRRDAAGSGARGRDRARCRPRRSAAHAGQGVLPAARRSGLRDGRRRWREARGLRGVLPSPGAASARGLPGQRGLPRSPQEPVGGRGRHHRARPGGTPHSEPAQGGRQLHLLESRRWVVDEPR